MKNFLMFFLFFISLSFSNAQIFLEKQDTPIINVLKNAGFESGKGQWSYSVSSTATIVSGTNAIQGAASLRFDSTAASQTVRSALYLMPSTKKTGTASECQSELRYLTNEATNKYLYQVLNGTGSIVSTLTLDAVSIPTTVTQFFTCPVSGQVQVISSGNGVKIDLDSTHLGTRKDINKADIVAALGYEPLATISASAPLTLTTTPSASNPIIGMQNSGVISGGTFTKFTVDGYGRVTSGTTLINSDLPDSGVIAGTYPKVTVNTKGVVTSGTPLIESDIPNLQTTKITSGVFTVPFGGTGVSSVTTGDLLVGAGSVLSKLPIGITGQVLSVSGGTAVWGTVSGTTSYPNFQNYTGSATVTTAQEIITVSATASITLTLPTPVGNAGKIFRITQLSGWGGPAGAVGLQTILVPTGFSGTICGQVTIKLTGQRDGLTIISDGVNWIGVSKTDCIASHFYTITPECTVNPCVFNYQTGGFLQHSRTSAGQYGLSFTSATWGNNIPVCTIQLYAAAGQRIPRSDLAISSSGITPFVTVEANNGGLSDVGFRVHCIGPR